MKNERKHVWGGLGGGAEWSVADVLRVPQPLTQPLANVPFSIPTTPVRSNIARASLAQAASDRGDTSRATHRPCGATRNTVFAIMG